VATAEAGVAVLLTLSQLHGKQQRFLLLTLRRGLLHYRQCKRACVEQNQFMILLSQTHMNIYRQRAHDWRTDWRAQQYITVTHACYRTDGQHICIYVVVLIFFVSCSRHLV
jgi:uncharacterized protein (DUF924 family)